MILLIDIGNTHTHVGLASGERITSLNVMPTEDWLRNRVGAALGKLVRGRIVKGVSLCSVVPSATTQARRMLKDQFGGKVLVLHPRHLERLGMGIDYPKPSTIGTDRLANAVASRHRLGSPSVVVDFGTAVTFDVVNRQGNYAGGVIAPGLAVMTHYLHEKTALLPAIEIRDTRATIGKSTEQAMLIGAVHGYRGLIKELIRRMASELRCRDLPVIATGGCARLIARTLPEIKWVDPLLTLDGLRLIWEKCGLVKS